MELAFLRNLQEKMCNCSRNSTIPVIYEAFSEWLRLHRREIAGKALYDPQTPESLRPENAKILIDDKYILAAMGLLSQYYPLAALEIMKKEIADYGHYE